MTWHPPVPRRVTDPAGKEWLGPAARGPASRQAGTSWRSQSPGQPGVLGGFFREGRFDPVTRNDSRLPALARESAQGRNSGPPRPQAGSPAHAGDTYIKVFRPGRAPAAATNHMLATAPLAGGRFRTPVMTAARPDVLVFSRRGRPVLLRARPGPDRRPGRIFAAMWADWSRAWTETVARASSSAFRPAWSSFRCTMPRRNWSAAALGRSLAAPQRRDPPRLRTGRAALLAQADAVTAGLLALPHDPLGWAHGDLHDKQMLGHGPIRSAPGLLDFDEACRAEAALDLANLDVHLELRRRQNLLTARRFAIAHASIVSAAERLHVSPERFAAYAASARLRLACMYSFRPPWGSWAVRYLASMDLVSPELRRSPECRAPQREPSRY